MFDWKWIFKLKTGEEITIYTRDGNNPSGKKTLIELARACSGGEGRSEDTLLKIGRSLEAELLNLEKQTPVAVMSSPAFSGANLF